MKSKNEMKTMSRRQRGVSLIELMVAITIALLLTLGLIQIFGASRVSSQVQEGLSRVQENGRFATQYLQRQMRMVGYMGCGSDVGRFTDENFVNHFGTFAGLVNREYRFQRPIEAFSPTMTLSPEFAGLTPAPDRTSDVLVLRVLSEESVPVISISKAANDLSMQIGQADAPFLPTPLNAAVMAVQNCRSADVFAASLTGTAPGSLVVARGATAPNVYLDPSCGNCPWDYRISNAFLNAKALVGTPNFNAEVHRGEYFAFYVAANPAGVRSLYVRRFLRDATTLQTASEELVEGVDNMQVRFGYDTDAGADGRINEYRTAAEVVSGATDEITIDDNWRRVLSVRVALLMRSPDLAGGGVSTENDGTTAKTYNVLGTTVAPGADGVMRQIYETTIALRNRLVNS